MAGLSHIEPSGTVSDSLPRFESLVHMLQYAVAESGDRTAIISGEDSISYSELGSVVAGLANELLRLGSSNSRVVVLIPNSVATVVAFFAAMAAHAQAAPVNPFYTERELQKIVADVDADFVVCVAGTRDLAASLAAAHGIRHLIDLDDAAWSRESLLQRGSEGLLDKHLPGHDDLALLIFTGGTTGVPKGVNHHHRSLLRSAMLHCTVWPVDVGNETVLNVAPLFHIWGLGYGVLVTVLARGTFVLVPRYVPEDVLRAIDEHQVTIFGGGPAPIYAGLVASDLAQQTDFSSLKYCLSGGAPCPEDLHRRWHELTGCAIFEGWGMSEGAPFCINRAAGPRKMLSVGPPVPETTIEIVDLETGASVLPVGESGEVRVRGPQVMSGYRNEPEETAQALRDGWLYTGDIGYIDGDGFLFLVDRKKDMAIVGGYNVYPREVDELLFMHPAIREACAVSRPDDRLGEVLVAFVARTNGATLDEETCLEYCRENLVKYKRPVAVYFVDGLPRTAANKIDKMALRKAAMQDEAADR